MSADQILIPPVVRDDSVTDNRNTTTTTNHSSTQSTNASTSTSTPGQPGLHSPPGKSTTTTTTGTPAPTSLSPLLAQLGVDPTTGIETTLSLFAFTAENDDELSFPANELIRIIEKDQEYNDGWYRGRNEKGEEGLFPASYVLPAGADPRPYLEMQQAPMPLNVGGGLGGKNPTTTTTTGEGESTMGLGIGGLDVSTSSSSQLNNSNSGRPGSPTKSLSRRKSNYSMVSSESMPTGGGSSGGGGGEIPPVPELVNKPNVNDLSASSTMAREDDGMVETREMAAKGQVQGPHAQTSELVSPAERAAAQVQDRDDRAGEETEQHHQTASTSTTTTNGERGIVAGAIAATTGLVGGIAGLAILDKNKGVDKAEDDDEGEDRRQRRLDRDITPMPEDGDRTITELEGNRTSLVTERGASSVDGGDRLDDDQLGTSSNNNNIRARLAEQARLENEKKERTTGEEDEADKDGLARNRAASDASVGLAAGPAAVVPGGATSMILPKSEGPLGRRQSNTQKTSGVRMSGGGVPHGLVYSDESDSDDEGSVVGGLGSPKRGTTNRRLGWEDEDEQAAKGFGFARFGAFGGAGGKAVSDQPKTSRLEQIEEKVASKGSEGPTLDPPAIIAVPLSARSVERIEPKAGEMPQPVPIVTPAPMEPIRAQELPAGNVSRGFMSPPVADLQEESPLGTPLPPLTEQRTSPFHSPPAPMFRRQRSGLSIHSREAIAAPPMMKSVSPVPQPVLSRKHSEEMGTPRSGAVTPKDVSRMSEAGSGSYGGNPHGWGVTEVIEWARSRGFDDAICEKFAEHEITGDVLLELDVNLLKELEIPQFGKRVKIGNAIADLRRPQSTTSMGNASNRSSSALARGTSMSQLGAAGSPTLTAGGYPTSPSYTQETGSRSTSAGAFQPSIPEDQAFDPEHARMQEQADPYLASSRPTSQPQTARSGAVTPGSGNYAEWAHSRKSSVSTSLVNAPIREEDETVRRDNRPPSVHQSITPDAPMSGMLPPADTHHRTNSIRSTASSIPSSPQTPNTKRSSTEQRAIFGHKKAKSSLDGVRPPSERMGFFGGTIGRNRKPAPRYPSNASTATFTREDPSTSPTGPDRQKSLSRLVGGGGGSRVNKSSIGPATAPVHGNQRISVGAPAAMSTSPTTPMRAPSSTFGGNSNVAADGTAIAKIGKPDFSGYVKKKGERYNTWKMRYFVLKGAHLYYMKSPQEDKVKGHIDLAGYKVLSDPNAGSGFGFQLVHDREKTHFFASNDHRVIKDWMKNLMKATISRDYSAPVVSSCNIPTIPLREAQMLAPRPPSPGEREAAQRAARRDDPNKLTPRDASVLMSLESSPTTGRRSTLSNAQGGGMSAPGRPSRDMRRPSEGRANSAMRPMETDAVPVQPPIVAPVAPTLKNQSTVPATNDTSSRDLLEWYNSRLPRDLPERATSLSSSFADGKLVTRLIESYCHPESSSAIPAEENIFDPVAPGEPNLEGLFTMMDKCIDEGVDTVGVSINDVRLGHEDETRRLLVSLKGWIEARERDGGR